MKTRFSHAYDIAFEVNTDHAPNDVTADELRNALYLRIRTLNDGELLEACGAPFDSFERD